MADGVPITSGIGTTIATDDVAGVHYQIVKTAYGALDSATLVSIINGLPVQGVGSFAVTGTFWQATQPVSAASLPLPAGAATEATLSGLSAKFGALGQTTMAGSAPVVIASNQSAIPVTLTSTTITGSVAVTGPLTDGQLRATPVPVSGTVTANLGTIAGVATETTLAALNTKVTAVNTGAVTISAALPAGANVIGALTANQSVNNTQINGVALSTGNGVTGTGSQRVTIASDNSPVPVSGTFTANPGVDITASGSIAANGQSVAIALNGHSGVAAQISGTWVGTLQFEGTVDGTTWVAVNAVRAGSSAILQTTTVNGLHRLTPSGLAQVRVIATAWTSGTATINLRASAATGGTFVNQIIPIQDGKEINATFRGRAQTFRTPGRAGTTGQKIFALHNATGSTKVVHINQLTIDLAVTVVKAITVLPPIIRIHRVTVLPTNGTALSKVAKDTALGSNTSVTVFGDASADGTSSGTTLTATIPAGSILTQEYAPRFITAAGYEMFDRAEMAQGAGIVLRALEGIVVELVYTAAGQNPITDMWIVGCDWYEI